MSGKGKKKNPNVGPVAVLVVGALALIGLFGYGIYQAAKSKEQQQAVKEMLKPNEYGCTASPVKNPPPGTERVPCKGADHVADGTKVTYESDPPLSGNHYGRWVTAGFYDKAQTPELLVHTLEHGNVVIYYNKAKLSAEQLDVVRGLAQQYKGQWDGVVAVPREDAKHALVLTAWEHALRLEAFDQARLDAFVDAFRGRGPENPVRF